MAEKVKIPVVGESITEVTLSAWLKQDRQHVAMDEAIAELESDKATFELTAPCAGILKILKPAGETLPIGAEVCEIEPSEQLPGASALAPTAVPSTEKFPSAPSALAAGAVKEMRVPVLGESINEVTLSNWLKQDGDVVVLDEIIAEVESDKANFELPAEAQGVLRIAAPAGSTLLVGDLICRIEAREGVVAVSSSAPAGVSTTTYAAGYPSPAARKILDEKGVSPHQVVGSGVGGRITKADALHAVPPAAGKKEPSLPSTASAPDPRGEDRQKMTSLRRTIARRLVAVKNETAMLTTFNEVNMQSIMELRERYKEKFKEKYGVSLGFMSFFVSAACAALKEFPAVNAYIDGDEVIYHSYCDISIAVSTPRGLVVPVIRNAELLRMDEIEKEVARLASRGRDGKLSIEEMTGGTFSITNGGIFGSMLSTPIINPPQAAILGMHNIVQRPVAIDGQVLVRPIMYLALSYDHRIIDGKESVSFLFRIKEMLEDPRRLILGI